MNRVSSLARSSYPWFTLGTLCTIALVPHSVGPGVVTVAGLLVGGIFSLLGLTFGARAPMRELDRFVTAALACLLSFGAASLLSDSPLLSLTGTMGQHAGLGLWLLGVVWLLAGAYLADAGTVRTTLRAVAIWGGLAAVPAIYEAVTFGSLRPQGFAGFFENSSSLGAALAVGSVSALVWALSVSSARSRAVPLALLSAMAGGLYVSGSRSAVLGVLAAVGGAWALRRLPDIRRDRPSMLAALACAVPTVVSVALVAGSSSAPVRNALAQWATHRDVVWRSAWAQFLQHPVVGSGLEQYSAFVSWEISPAGVVHKTTGDPHNVVLALLLGGGVIGACLAVYATWTMLTSLFAATASSRSWAAALVIAVPLIPFGFSVVGWIPPSAMIAIAAVTGSVIGSQRARMSAGSEGAGAAKSVARTRDTKKRQDRSALPNAVTVRWAGITIAVASLAVSALGLRMLPVQYAFAATSMDIDDLIRAYRTWPEPAVLVAATRLTTERLTSAPGPDAAGDSVLDLGQRDASWRADAAAVQLSLGQYLEANDPSRYPRVERIAQAGERADPSSGYWQVFAAHEACRLKLNARAESHARHALAFELDSGNITRMRDLSASQPITQK